MIIKSEIPKTSKLFEIFELYDYSDCFLGTFTDPEGSITTIDICRSFFTSAPGWSRALFEMRNRFVSLIGLKTPGKESFSEEALENFKCEEGQRLGLFKVFLKEDHEIILGEEDKHLNFRISILREKEDGSSWKLRLSTVVQFHNRLGKIYFWIIRPFHVVIVKQMLKRIIQNVEAHASRG